MSEFSEAFIAVMDYVESQGAANLKDVEACWESAVDEHWWIALNGHTKGANCTKGVPVDPYCCYIEFDGLPAGLLNAFGGEIVVGEAANEDSFIDAIRAATEAQKNAQECTHCGEVDPVKAELLATLQELWACAETYDEFNDPRHDWFSLRYQVQDAIAKAEGRVSSNARPIAAPPDLLEATESLLELLCALIREEVWEVDSEYPEDYERLNAARAAIAKAKGRKS